MNKKLVSWFTAIMLIVITIIPATVAADTGIDTTPPEVKSISIVDAGKVNADGSLKLKINLVEEGVGVVHAAVWIEGFEEGWGWSAAGDTGTLQSEMLFI